MQNPGSELMSGGEEQKLGYEKAARSHSLTEAQA